MSRKANPCQNEKGKKTLESGGKVVTESRASPHPCRNRKESRGAGGLSSGYLERTQFEFKSVCYKKRRENTWRSISGTGRPKGCWGSCQQARCGVGRVKDVIHRKCHSPRKEIEKGIPDLGGHSMVWVELVSRCLLVRWGGATGARSSWAGTHKVPDGQECALVLGHREEECLAWANHSAGSGTLSHTRWGDLAMWSYFCWLVCPHSW